MYPKTRTCYLENKMTAFFKIPLKKVHVCMWIYSSLLHFYKYLNPDHLNHLGPFLCPIGFYPCLLLTAQFDQLYI